MASAAGTPGAAMPRAQKAQRLGLRPAWPRAGGARSPEPAHNPAQGTRPSGWGCGQPGHPTDLRKNKEEKKRIKEEKKRIKEEKKRNKEETKRIRKKKKCQKVKEDKKRLRKKKKCLTKK